MAQRVMNKALGGSNASTEPLVDKRGGRGTLQEPTQLARNLGMPSASSRPRVGGANKDWSASSNRISMGAPVYMQSKTRVDDEWEDRGYVEERGGERMDPLIAGALAQKSHTATSNKDDPAFAALSDEEDELGLDGDSAAVAAWRAARMAELKKKSSRTNDFLGMGHGSLLHVTQDDFLKHVTQSKYVVCHFYHPEFERCKIMDQHLERLAPKHLATKWIKIDATKAPFFVGKLQIKMLPTLVFFKDGIARDRMVGLDDVGARDDFNTSALEKRIEKGGVIMTKDKNIEEEEEKAERAKRTKNSIRQSKFNDSDSEDEDD